MPLITVRELFDIVVMIAAVGYIFMGAFQRKYGWDWRTFGFACLVTAPALILHELLHKFLAIGFGYQATFQAAYLFLGLGIILRLLRSRFIFFVPGFVGIAGAPAIPPFQHLLIAFAGPAMNLLLFLGSLAWLRWRPPRSRYARAALVVTRTINLWLFILNMLPIPGFDGFHVFRGLVQAFF